MNLNIAMLLSVRVERPTLFRATSLQAVRSQYFDIQIYFSVFREKAHKDTTLDRRMST